MKVVSVEKQAILGWDVVRLIRASDRHATDADSLVRQGIFLAESTFSADSFGVRTPLCAIAYINICAHDKDYVVRVRVRWIMATQSYPARTVSDKNNQLDDCGRSSAMSMLLQHGCIRALKIVITIIIVIIYHQFSV